MRQGSSNCGFSLVELLIVIALAAVILAIAAPSFADFQRNSRITGAANDLLGTIQTARTEAIKRQASVSVCPSADPAAIGATCIDGPFLGWIAFADTDNDCIRDANEEILRVGERIANPSGNPLSALSSGSCISFAATGFLQLVGENTASQTLFCDNRGLGIDGSGSLANAENPQSFARGVEVSPTGRARVTRDSVELTEWAPDVTCPFLPSG